MYLFNEFKGVEHAVYCRHGVPHYWLHFPNRNLSSICKPLLTLANIAKLVSAGELTRKGEQQC